MADVVVADDSPFMRVQIRDILEAGGFTVVAEAANGTEALEAVRAHDPDVVTMDVKMPGMNGIEAVERIVAERPTPTLMLSRYTEEGSTTTFDALNAGAVDFFPKPGGEVSAGLVNYTDDLLEKVQLVADATVPLETGSRGEAPDTSASTPAPGLDGAESTPAPGLDGAESTPTLVIAASAGGPPVVERVLRDLPGTLGLRVIVVQHMPDRFTGRFADRLDSQSDLAVREATATDRLSPNEAVVAKGGYHLEVTGEDRETLELELTEGPPVHNVRPAADVTLESAVEVSTGPLLAAVFSGMGKDAAAGIERVSADGGATLAQDPDSARVGGMPSSAVATGVVDATRPPDRIANWVVERSV